MVVKAVLFDMDGTLIDSMPALENLAVEVIQKHFEVDEQRARMGYRRTAGIPFGLQLESLFPNKDVYKAEQEYLELKRLPTLNAPVIRSSLDVLKNAKVEGLTTGLVSSTIFELVNRVEKTKFTGYFDFVSGVMPLKPAQIERFIFLWRLKASEVLYYGDTAEDAAIARRYGMQFQEVVSGSPVKLP